MGIGCHGWKIWCQAKWWCMEGCDWLMSFSSSSDRHKAVNPIFHKASARAAWFVLRLWASCSGTQLLYFWSVHLKHDTLSYLTYGIICAHCFAASLSFSEKGLQRSSERTYHSRGKQHDLFRGYARFQFWRLQGFDSVLEHQGPIHRSNSYC